MQEPEILDLECGSTEHPQDKLELPKVIIGKIKPYLHGSTYDGLGHGNIAVTNAMEGNNDAKFKLHSDHNSIQRFNSVINHLNVSIRFN